MVLKNKTIFLIFYVSVFFLISFLRVDAAIITLLPEGGQFDIGQEFTVDIKIDTEDTSINATQATITFPTDVLELLEASKSGSVFNFWVEGPTISNENGTVSFIGGTAKGVSGRSLQILKMKFKTKGTGSAEFSVSNAVVTASDGKGTNVLSAIEEANITVGTLVVKSTPAPVTVPASTPILKPVVQPQKIVRTVALSKVLPNKPELTVALYPDESRWYSQLGEVIVLWDAPPDITNVAVELDKSLNTVPSKAEDKLFTGKSFGTLEEGVWYIHVQFKNNIGWGKVRHYKIALDTTAPLPFEIEMDAKISDNPAPNVRFDTQDSFSGISYVLIFINEKEPLKTTETTLELPLQPLGKHTLLVRVFDRAGNSVEDDVEFEILPLQTPIIDFITRGVSQDEFVFVSGKSIPNTFIDTHVLDENNQEIFVGFVTSDARGDWEIIIEKPFARGKYSLTATARDDRGAQSFPTEAEVFKIRAKTVISFGFVDFGWFEILLFVILAVSSSGGILAWYYIAEEKKREAYRIIAARDVEKLTTLLVNDVNGLETWFQEAKIDENSRVEAESFFKKIKDTAYKMKKYLGRELGKIK